MIKHRSAIVAGIVVFLLMVTGGGAVALWTASAQVTSTVAAGTTADWCNVNRTGLVNGNFELAEPLYPGQSGIKQTSTTDNFLGWNSSTDNNIELWTTNSMTSGADANIPAANGRWFIELNGHEPNTIYQQVSTTPGDVLQWSFSHRGRAGASTPANRVTLLIGANAGVATVQGTFNGSTSTWTQRSGSYTVPAGQTSTWFAIRAVTPGSIGNFIDAVSFGSAASAGPCLATSTRATTPGTVDVGQTVTFSTIVENPSNKASSATSFTANLPAHFELDATSIRVNGATPAAALVSMTGAVATGQAVTVRLGTGATGATGGALASGAASTITLNAQVKSAAAGTSGNYLSRADYADALSPNWLQTAAADPIPFTTRSDNQAPSAPILSRGTPTSQVVLNWTASTDNTGVVAYDVYRNGASVGTVDATAPRTFTDPNTTAWQVYNYTVLARDAAGNTATSNVLEIATGPGGLSTNSGYGFTQQTSEWYGTATYCVTDTNGNIRISESSWWGSPCSPTDWQFVPTDSGFVKIVKQGTSSAWVKSGNSVSLTTNSTSHAAQWTIAVNGDGFSIMNRDSSQCAVRGNNTVTLANCSGTAANQRWTID